jgi:hypothetical protein
MESDMSKSLRALFASMWLLAACTPAAPEPEEAGEDSGAGLFVMVHIPESIEPLERGSKYEDPLNAALQAQGLGEVTGGGTQLGPPKADGSSEVTAVDIDVDLVDAERGLPALRAELRKLNPPKGTELSYEGEDGEHIKEVLW